MSDGRIAANVVKLPELLLAATIFYRPLAYSI
jgi:hypothetical protein